MEKGIILRVPDELDLPQEVVKKLEELFPGHTKQVYSNLVPNYKNSLIERINSLHNAFLFLLEAYPLNPKFTPIVPDTLKLYVSECRKACNLESESFEKLHTELEVFCAKLINVIATCWFFKTDPIKRAIGLLNDADSCYMQMNEGRPSLVTLMPFESHGEKKYIVQYDKSLPAHYELFISEINIIKSKNVPKTPSWFRKLLEHEQAYFCNLKYDIFDSNTLIKDLNDFITTWNTIKEESLNIQNDLRAIATNIDSLPAWFDGLQFPLQEMVRVLAKSSSPDIEQDALNLINVINLNAKSSKFIRALLLIPKIPQWYWNISTSQQYFLEHLLNNTNSVEGAFGFIGSRDRTMPIPSNFGAHELLKITSSGEVTTYLGKRYRSSHVGSRDCLHHPEAVQKRHSESNLAKVMEHASPGSVRLMQTLISPIHATEYIPTAVVEWLPELPPDKALYELARAAVAKRGPLESILEHNHPVNYANLYYFTPMKSPESLGIIQKAREHYHKCPGLKELVADYKFVLKACGVSDILFDPIGRELFLSSLEQLIILKMGGFSYGSCVSGKDRKGLELIHTDAMILYEEKYGCLPKFNDTGEKRSRFVTIFVDIYLTRHQHFMAGQNALGSDGIKTPEMYLSKDIRKAIKARLNMKLALYYDDRLATDNEVKHISKPEVLKSRLISQNDMLCKLLAKQLGETLCSSLYSSLGFLINQTEIFKPPKSWSPRFQKTPVCSTVTAITLIRNVMENELLGNNMNRMEKIFSIICAHPVENKPNTSATQSVYDRIMALFEPRLDKNSSNLACCAIKEWDQLFDQSKENHIEMPTRCVV